MRKKFQSITLPENAHILVVKLATIGDLLLATPALRALRETYPHATIDLLVTPASAGLLDGWNAIDNIIVLDKYLFDYGLQVLKNPPDLLRLRPLWQKLRNGHYDAVLLLHHLTLPFGRLKHQLLMRATGARWRVGLDNGHGWFLNVRVKDNGFGAMHEADYNLAVAQAVGASTNDRRLAVPLGETDYAQAWQLVYRDEAPNAVQRPIIAIHAGSGGYSTARRWAPEKFAQLADTLFHDTGGQLLLMGGPEEAELNQQIMAMMQSDMPVRNLAGKGSIKVAAAVLEQADLFVGNDAGLMHLSTAAGTPAVAIFGLSNWKAWGPYVSDPSKQKAIIVRLDLPCMPCFYRGHDLGTPEGCMTRDCLAMLGVDPVAVAARRLLRNAKSKAMHP
ncbi:MAG TPA: glycosyltransferase family 9 protein [Ktedonobacteraceae bacterium]